MYLGSWKIDDLLTFVVNTQVFSTGVATDADSPPAYRIYEDETSTPILTGTMALLDSANTAGFYSEQITLSAANGFEKGKSYSAYISATVSSVAGATHRNFQIEAEVDANRVNWASVDNATTTVGLTNTTISSSQVVASVTGAVGSVTGSVGSVTGAVGSVTGSVGSVTGSVGSVAAGGITAASIATGAIDADALAPDAVNEIADGVWDEAIAGHLSAGSTGEALSNAGSGASAADIADAVWDEDATGHQSQGTFGQAIGDPVADANTIYKATVTDAAGATVGVDVVAIKAETAAILVDTAEIGAAGAGLTAIVLSSTERNAIADAHLDRTDAIETGLTPRGAHRLEAAASAGVLSGAATANVVIRNAVADSKDRIDAVVDQDGNRISVSTDVT